MKTRRRKNIFSKRHNGRKQFGGANYPDEKPAPQGQNKNNGGGNHSAESDIFWTGKTALKLGLVDGIGNADQVLKEKFGEKVIIKNFEKRKGFLAKKLSSSIQAFTGLVNSNLAEYPMQLKSLAWDITENHILMNNDGLINIPSDIGHGMIINEDALKDYKVDVEIKINNRKVF